MASVGLEKPPPRTTPTILLMVRADFVRYIIFASSFLMPLIGVYILEVTCR